MCAMNVLVNDAERNSDKFVPEQNSICPRPVGSHVFRLDKFAGVEGCGGAVFDSEFSEDDLEMFLYRVRREDKVPADFFVRFSHAEPVNPPS
jgi:hypothetical protein